jgi:hypothetical protein
MERGEEGPLSTVVVDLFYSFSCTLLCLVLVSLPTQLNSTHSHSHLKSHLAFVDCLLFSPLVAIDSTKKALGLKLAPMRCSCECPVLAVLAAHTWLKRSCVQPGSFSPFSILDSPSPIPTDKLKSINFNGPLVRISTTMRKKCYVFLLTVSE